MHDKLIRKELLALAILIDDERYYGEMRWRGTLVARAWLRGAMDALKRRRMVSNFSAVAARKYSEIMTHAVQRLATGPKG